MNWVCLVPEAIHSKLLLLCYLLFCATTQLFAQAIGCNDPHASAEANAAAQRQWEDASSPVFADANELAKTLNERGFHVQCIRRSTGEHLFPGQKGAAWFKTDGGIFDVWFLPKPESFSSFEIQERQENGEFAYSFRGTPQIDGRIAGIKRNYFISYKNVLFIVVGDEPLATRIRSAFQSP